MTAEVMSLWVVLAEASPQAFIAALGRGLLDAQLQLPDALQQELVVSPASGSGLWVGWGGGWFMGLTASAAGS